MDLEPPRQSIDIRRHDDALVLETDGDDLWRVLWRQIEDAAHLFVAQSLVFGGLAYLIWGGPLFAVLVALGILVVGISAIAAICYFWARELAAPRMFRLTDQTATLQVGDNEPVRRCHLGEIQKLHHREGQLTLWTDGGMETIALDIPEEDGDRAKEAFDNYLEAALEGASTESPWNRE